MTHDPARPADAAWPPDVTASALRDSELRYRRLFEAAQDGIVLLDAETGQIDDANPYLTHMLGYSHDELLGKKLWEVGAFADIDKNTDMFERLKAEGYVRYDDLPLKTRDGVLVSVEFVSNAYDCAGVRVIQCNIRNITAQRLAEAQVRTLSLVVEQSPVEIVIANPAGVIEYVNPALWQSSGYGEQELIGAPLRTLRSEATSLQTLDAMDAAARQGSVWRGELQSRRKDGTEYPAFAVVAPIHHRDGSPIGSVTITEDITERQRAVRELARHGRELEVLVDARTAELAVAKRAAETANVAKSAFLSNMSHEIRTPLGAITGLAYLLRRTPLTAQQADWLTKLDLAGAHLLALIDAILELSKIEAGKLALDESDVNAGRIAASVVSILSERAAAKHLNLVVEIQPLPRGLVGDPARLQQALLNYAANAVKFTATGQVTLRARCEQETADSALLRFEVQDTGPGIAAQALPRLFSAFEQADNSTAREFGGTGLGLAIVRQLARLMGGESGAQSTPGAGSTFWFTAMLRKQAHADAAPPLDPGSAEARLARDHSGARVLLVDDDELNREVGLALLRTVMNRVDFAADGPGAIRMAEEFAYDLILMDVQMPGLNGLEATRLIRMLPGGAATVIVALTANAFVEDRAACLVAGMDDFLAKPFRAEVFFGVLLNGLLRHRKRQSPSPSGGADTGSQ